MNFASKSSSPGDHCIGGVKWSWHLSFLRCCIHVARVQQGSLNKNPQNPSRWRISGDWSCRCKVSQFLPALWFTGENWLTTWDWERCLMFVASCSVVVVLKNLNSFHRLPKWRVVDNDCHVYSWTCSVIDAEDLGFPPGTVRCHAPSHLDGKQVALGP